MRALLHLARLGGACVLCALTGCATPRQIERTGAPGVAAPLDPQQEAFANALAHYGQAIIYEYNRNQSAAFSNYVKAAELDPLNEELHFRVALGYLQRKQFSEAIAVMERYCERPSVSEKALLWLALIYRAAEEPEKALKTYERATRVAPASPAAYLEMAALYARAGRESQAIRLLNRALKRVNNPTELLYSLGEMYIRDAARADGKTDARQIKTAVQIFEKAVRDRPDDQTLLYLLGDLYILNHDLEKAIACYEIIESRNPSDLRIKQKLAMSLAASGNRERAIHTLQDMSRRQPANAHIYYYLGELYAQSGDREKALFNYSLAAKAGDPEPAAYLKLAILYIDQEPEKAMDVLKEGMHAMPDEPRIVEMLAYVCLGRKDYDKALTYFALCQKMMDEKRVQPMTPNFHLNYAIATQLAGKTSEAASLLQKAMGINRGYLDAYIQYAFRDRANTNILQSVHVLDKLGESTPDDPSLFIYLGFLNSYAKLYPAAIAAFEKAERLVEASPDKEDLLTETYYFWYGAACERDGQYERAEIQFKKCIEMNPDHAEAHNYLAYMWAERGINLDRALTHIEKALEINPESPAFIDTLGWIYYMQQRYEEALVEIRRAANKLPHDPTITEHLGDVLHKLGEQEQALTHWKESFVLDPNNQKMADKLQAMGVDLEPLRQKAANRQEQMSDMKDEATPDSFTPFWPSGSDDEPEPVPLPVTP